MTDVFSKFDIKVFDAFIEKFAQKYVDLRSTFSSENADSLLAAAESLGSGFDITQIKSIVRRNSTYTDPVRENGQTPSTVLNDIYRSDLGELLTGYYFEEKLGAEERYVIPLKNISFRERYDMPGRGNDVLGYRVSEDGSISLLLGEAKVSGQNTNPPSVVDASRDSIYNAQKNYHDNMETVSQRLCDYLRRLTSPKDIEVIGCAIMSLESGEVSITYGCGLVRDYSCVKDPEDFGKMRTDVESFRPGSVHFAIFSFSNATIESAVQQFYEKVKEISR